VIYDMFRKNNRCWWSCNGGILFLWYFNIVNVSLQFVMAWFLTLFLLLYLLEQITMFFAQQKCLLRISYFSKMRNMIELL